MGDFLLCALNFCSAQILGDTERPRVIEASWSRRVCRFILTALAILGFMAIITMFLFNQPPKRFRRVWIKKEDSRNVTRFLDRRALQLNSVEWQCPCKATNIVALQTTGAHLVDFYLIKNDPSEKALQVDSIEHFCAEMTKTPYFMGFNGTCNELLKESFRLSGWDYQRSNTNLYMSSLRTASLNPISFMLEVCMSWAGGLSQASSFYIISNYGLTKNKSQQLNTFLRAIKTSLETCAKHTSWPPPNSSLYLTEAKSAGLDSAKFEYTLAISFNWSQYFTTCSPSYCDHMQSSSYKWLLFTALAQVGGFVSVTLFALRSAIWPLLCMICGWPSALKMCDESKEAKNSELQGGEMDCCKVRKMESHEDSHFCNFERFEFVAAAHINHSNVSLKLGSEGS